MPALLSLFSDDEDRVQGEQVRPEPYLAFIPQIMRGNDLDIFLAAEILEVADA